MRHLLTTVALLCAAFSATAEPPTVSRETTYSLGPIDDEGYVDYVAAVNAAFGDPQAEPEDNIFAGLLTAFDTSHWPEEHRGAIFAELDLSIPGNTSGTTWVFESFYEQWEKQQKRPRPEPTSPQDPEAPFAGFDFEVQLSPGEEMYERVLEGPWTAEEFPVAAAWLKQLEPGLAATTAAIQRKAYYAPLVKTEDPSLMVSILLPHLGDFRRLSRTYRIRINLYLSEERLDPAIDDWLTLQRLGRMITRESSVISKLVGISISTTARETLDDLLDRQGLTADQVAQLREGYTQLPAREEMIRSVQNAERIYVLDTAQEILRGRLKDKTYGALHKLIANSNFDQDQVLNHFNAYYDRYQASPRTLEEIEQHDSATEAYFRKSSPDQLKAEIAAAGEKGNSGEFDTDRIAVAVADMLLHILAPALSSAFKTELTAKTSDDLVTLALALESYRVDHAAYPDQLDTLVPRYIQSVPLDFASQEPMKYRVEPGGFVVYSYGRNLVDDGGLDDFREGDLVLRVDRNNRR